VNDRDPMRQTSFDAAQARRGWVEKQDIVNNAWPVGKRLASPGEQDRAPGPSSMTPCPLIPCLMRSSGTLKP
jgi:hypothetical protein